MQIDKKAQYLEGRKVTIIGALTNLVLTVAKLAAGILGRSDALIADAVHSLSDLVSDIVVLVSLKVSQRPVDEDRPYGYGKVETVGTGLLGLILIAVAVEMFIDAALSITRGVETIPGKITLVAAIFSILANELLYQYTVRVGRRVHSTSIMANAWHHRSDALSSVAALAGAGAATMGWPIFDPIAALVVTLLILKVGWEIVRESFSDIIDTSVKKEIREQIIQATLSTEGAMGCHDLKTRKMGSDILVDIHVEVNATLNVYDAHLIADAVRDNIMEKVPHIADVLVHLDPGDDSDLKDHIMPEKELMEKIADMTAKVKGVKGWAEMSFRHEDEGLCLVLSLILEPELTIAEAYPIVKDIKQSILDIEKIRDATITVSMER